MIETGYYNLIALITIYDYSYRNYIKKNEQTWICCDGEDISYVSNRDIENIYHGKSIHPEFVHIYIYQKQLP